MRVLDDISGLDAAIIELDTTPTTDEADANTTGREATEADADRSADGRDTPDVPVPEP
jgi:hypothetical protein